VVYASQVLRILIACCATAPSPDLDVLRDWMSKGAPMGCYPGRLLNTFMESSRTNLRSGQDETISMQDFTYYPRSPP